MTLVALGLKTVIPVSLPGSFCATMLTLSLHAGCACDIPSVNYQFSWKIKLWSHYYSYSPEIWEYLKDIEREGRFIDKYVKLRHQIEEARWDDDRGIWRFKIRNLKTNDIIVDEAEFFVNAGGVLNNYKWPEITGLQSFKGKLMHSAAYEEGYDLKGKRVAVIGAGSSGVQCVAKIQKEVDKLYHWVRSPIWITASFGQRWASHNGNNFACKYCCGAVASQEVKMAMSTNTHILQIQRNSSTIWLRIRKSISNTANRSKTN
jgi:cation diffusion facilitator CzcD-associated flavoprotein CzcO